MRTILSRVRTYPFVARDASASHEVLAKVFRADVAPVEGGGPALLTPERWLASKRPFPPEKARQFATSLVAAIMGERLAAGCVHGENLREAGEAARMEGLDIASALAATLSGSKELGQKDEGYAGSLDALFAAMESILGEGLRRPGLLAVDMAWMARAADIIREARLRRDSYKLPGPTLLETLAYNLRDTEGAGA